MTRTYAKKPRTRIDMDTGTRVMDHKKSRSEEEREAILEELDDILDEIDEVLQDVGDEVAETYVQRGGE